MAEIGKMSMCIMCSQEEKEMSADHWKYNQTAISPSSPRGPNGIHPRVLKELADVIAAPLPVFLKSLGSPERLQLTEKWQKFKKGEKEDPGNYRFVSLT